MRVVTGSRHATLPPPRRWTRDTEADPDGDAPSASVDPEASDRCRRDANGTEPGMPHRPAEAGDAIAGFQRARVMQAVLDVLSEHGCAGASVGLIVERAKVSRRTFNRLFPGGLEAGFMAVMDEAMERTSVLVLRAFEGEEAWLDMARMALAAILAFLDSEPALARVCMVEALGGGKVVLGHRERILRDLRALMVTRIESVVPGVAPLAAEGVMAAILGIIHARLAADECAPLVELLGPMMGRIVTPLITSEPAIRAEIRRGDELARAIQAGDVDWAPPVPTSATIGSALPVSLANPNAYRARECILFLAEHPDASNREIALGIAIAHQPQISKLLSRLVAEGLVAKHSEGAGKRNALRLTQRGEEIARALSEQPGQLPCDADLIDTGCGPLRP
jgi:AcrR family transcriptional regulator